MLYVTTRNNRDAFTAHKVLRGDRAQDGGMYLPLHMQGFSVEEIASLKEKTFGEAVAMVLNRLFNLQLSGWDIDFCIGRYPARLALLQHRIYVAETWHNPKWSYEWVVNNLVGYLCDDSVVPGNWAKIAVQISVLFGIMGDLMRKGIERTDISLVSGDFSAVISAWYARKWGLPIGNIICSCNENKAVWDLVCQGQLRTDIISVPTITPEADAVIPENLEYLIFECGGYDEVRKFLQCMREGKAYFPGDNIQKKLRTGLHVSVVSSSRAGSTISGVYGTSKYILSPYGALAYAGLLDYRARTGETRHAVVLPQISPGEEQENTAQLMGISVQTLKSLLE